MKTFDFSKLGGFPLTQDGLDFMQQATREPLLAIAQLGGAGPFIISGMTVAGSMMSSGTLYYNGDIIPFIGGTIGATIVVNTYKTTLEYGDGNNYQTQSRTEASFGTGPVQFNYADLKLFQEAFGARPVTSWITLTPSIGATCEYRLNKMTNTVFVRGTFTHSQLLSSGNPQMIPVIPDTFPTAIRPSQTVFFRTSIETHLAPIILDGNGSTYVGEIGRVTSGGYIGISSRTLESGTANPTHNFNFSYQL